MKIKIGEREYPGRGSENKTMQAYAASHLQSWRFHKEKKPLLFLNQWLPLYKRAHSKRNSKWLSRNSCQLWGLFSQLCPPPLFLSQSQGCKYLSVLYPCQRTLERVKGTWHWITGICVANKYSRPYPLLINFDWNLNTKQQTLFWTALVPISLMCLLDKTVFFQVY